MKNKVLVTGATGATGANAIKRLLELQIPVRAMVHSLDSRSEALTEKGVEVVEGDLSDFDSVSAALKGISSAYFVYPVTVPGLLEATSYFAQAALEENVELIVNMSQRTSRRETKSHAARNHWFAERLLDRSGVPVVHLRPTLFAEWLLYFASQIKENNRLISPFGNARYAPLAGEDTGRVIASILANPEGHAGQTYPLFGPVALTQFEVAQALTQVLSREIVYIPMEIEAFAEVLKSTGMFSPYFIQHVSAVAQDFRDGLLTGENNFVEEISGQKPMRMTDFIEKNIGAFQ